MNTPLSHLINMPDDIGMYEPRIEHAPIGTLIRKAKSDREEVRAKAEATAFMMQHGLQATTTDEEERIAEQQFHRHIQHLPIDTHKINHPAVILKLTAMLSEYDHEVVRDAAQMRQYVTNRLLEESDSKMPAQQRLAALKLLGQITEVGLFTERTEITVKTMPMENLEAKLYDKLKTLLPQEYTAIAREVRGAEESANETH